VVAACVLASVTMVPVAANATGTVPTPGPTAPSPRPAPPPPPPVNHYKTRLPVGPADTGPVVAAIQQRLIWLGERVKLTKVMDRATLAALAHFRWKFGLAASTTVTTTAYSKLSSISRAHGVLPAACRTSGIVLCIDKTQKSLRFVRAGKVVLTTDARFGSDALPTREGTFHVQRKDATHVSTLYHTSMPYSMFFSGGQAVHYSPYFHRDGYNGHSHGCVNIHDLSTAKWLFAHSPIGTKVVVHRS
jgi:hypothetical protein